jgi:hypothetical protein
MSNTNTVAPFGLTPINENGTPWSGQGMKVYFPTSQAGNIFLGDPLVPLGGADAFGVPSVGIASAGATNTVLGSFQGITNGPSGSGFTVTRDLPVYRQASIANYGFVCADPNQLFAIQDDGTGTTAAIGGFCNANLVAGAGGSTATGYSSWALGASTMSGSANATYQIRVLGLLRGPGVFAAPTTYATWVVRINLPALWAASGY